MGSRNEQSGGVMPPSSDSCSERLSVAYRYVCGVSQTSSSGVREFSSDDWAILHPTYPGVNLFAGSGKKCDRIHRFSTCVLSGACSAFVLCACPPARKAVKRRAAEMWRLSQKYLHEGMAGQ